MSSLQSRLNISEKHAALIQTFAEKLPVGPADRAVYYVLDTSEDTKKPGPHATTPDNLYTLRVFEDQIEVAPKGIQSANQHFIRLSGLPAVMPSQPPAVPSRSAKSPAIRALCIAHDAVNVPEMQRKSSIAYENEPVWQETMRNLESLAQHAMEIHAENEKEISLTDASDQIVKAWFADHQWPNDAPRETLYERIYYEVLGLAKQKYSEYLDTL